MQLQLQTSVSSKASVIVIADISPSIVKFWPLIHQLSGLARNMKISAISLGVPGLSARAMANFVGLPKANLNFSKILDLSLILLKPSFRDANRED